MIAIGLCVHFVTLIKGAAGGTILKPNMDFFHFLRARMIKALSLVPSC